MNDADDFIERMERMTITVKSPDESVTASFRLVEGITITLDHRRAARHDAESLAEQVRKVVSGVKQGYSKGITAGLGGGADPGARAEPDPVRDEYSRQVFEYEHWETSPRGLVKIGFRGNEEVEVSVRPGALERSDVSMAALEADINTALARSVEAAARHRERVYEQTHGLTAEIANERLT